LRRSEAIRSLARETRLSTHGFIYPMFVCPGKNVRNPIGSMPEVAQQSVDMFLEECREVEQLGIPGIILFGIPEKKDARGTEAYASDGVVQRAIEAVRNAKLNLLVMTDVCLCEYTDHGHCGIVENGEVKNDPTLELLAAESLSHAPSDMMDGRVGAIRTALDGAGFQDVAIMSYAAKYCSGFYGPFREAAESAPQFGDRRGYQMDPANAREALREVELDLAEGADMVMVKPALAYLDVIQRVRETFSVPVGAYNVSGEYSMVKAAAANGWIDEQRTVLEILTGISRAGAGIILTYHAKDAARWLKNC
jgi:porphobilinogen synthase